VALGRALALAGRLWRGDRFLLTRFAMVVTPFRFNRQGPSNLTTRDRTLLAQDRSRGNVLSRVTLLNGYVGVDQGNSGVVLAGLCRPDLSTHLLVMGDTEQKDAACPGSYRLQDQNSREAAYWSLRSLRGAIGKRSEAMNLQDPSCLRQTSKRASCLRNHKSSDPVSSSSGAWCVCPLRQQCARFPVCTGPGVLLLPAEPHLQTIRGKHIQPF